MGQSFAAPEEGVAVKLRPQQPSPLLGFLPSVQIRVKEGERRVFSDSSRKEGQSRDDSARRKELSALERSQQRQEQREGLVRSSHGRKKGSLSPPQVLT